MWRFWAFIVSIIIVISPMRVSAQGEALQSTSAPCLIHTNLDTGPKQFLEQKGQWQCENSENILKGPRVWVLFNESDIIASGEKPVLNFHAGRFDAFHLYEKFADGSVKKTNFRGSSAIDFPHKAADFRIPLGKAKSVPVRVALAIDAPYNVSIVSRAYLLSGTNIQSGKYLTLGASLLLGGVLIVLLFNFIFYRILRERFLIMHQIMISSAMIYVSVNTGIFFEFLPQVSVKATAYLSQISFSVMAFTSAIFAVDIIESEKLTPSIKKLLQLCGLWIVIFTAITVFPIEAIRPYGQKFYYFAFLPVIVIYSIAIISALWAGSRVARYQAIAWLPMILAGGERIFRMLDFYQGPSWLDNLMYAAFAFELIVTSLSAADRFMTIKQQRDKARNKAQIYAERSKTDMLTDLPNRRDFEAVFEQNQSDGIYDQIALIDLDHFKSINDQFGHMLGDDVLRAFAREAKQHGHYIARIGGEEFVLLLDSKHAGDINAALNQFRIAISTAIKEHVSAIDTTVTVSIGYVPILPNVPMRNALDLADKRLYQAKEAGRNCVIGGASFSSSIAA